MIPEKTLVNEEKNAIYHQMNEIINELRLTGDERFKLERINDMWERLVDKALTVK